MKNLSIYFTGVFLYKKSSPMKKIWLFLLVLSLPIFSYKNLEYGQVAEISDTKTDCLIISDVINGGYNYEANYKGYTVKYIVITSCDAYTVESSSTSKEWLSYQRLSPNSNEFKEVVFSYCYLILGGNVVLENKSVLKIIEKDNNTRYDREGSISISTIDSSKSTLFIQKKISYNVYDDYSLLNKGINGSPVSIKGYSSYEKAKNNKAENTLDKKLNTSWKASDRMTGDGKEDGECIIYDLGSVVDLKAIRLVTDVKLNPYGYQIWVSEKGIDDFIKIIPDEDSLFFSSAFDIDDFQLFLLEKSVRYVKIVVFGRFTIFKDCSYVKNTDWTGITEVEFLIEKEY